MMLSSCQMRRRAPPNTGSVGNNGNIYFNWGWAKREFYVFGASTWAPMFFVCFEIFTQECWNLPLLLSWCLCHLFHLMWFCTLQTRSLLFLHWADWTTETLLFQKIFPNYVSAIIYCIWSSGCKDSRSKNISNPRRDIVTWKMSCRRCFFLFNNI